MKYGKIIATLMALIAVLMTGQSAYATGSKSCNPLATAVKNIAVSSMMQPRKKGARFAVSSQDAKILPKKAGKKIDLGNGFTAVSLRGDNKTRQLKITPPAVRGGAIDEEEALLIGISLKILIDGGLASAIVDDRNDG